ncbi:MAG: hypothetical protein WDO68_20585 [Gammaproteobacteria bacterium]
MSRAANSTAAKRSLTQALLASLVLASVALTGSEVTVAATAAPLLQQSNMKYLGSFTLTNKAGVGGCSASRAGYGGAGLSYYKDPSTGKGTLFMEGNVQVPGCIGQFEIPSIGGTAPQLQNFQDISDGKWKSVSSCGAGCPTGGLLAYNGKLFVDAFEYYGDKQPYSHGYSNINLSTSGDFKGWYTVTPTAGNSRTVAGWMAPVPSEYQSALGGTALTGNCCQAIISASSAGPSVSVFNPDDLVSSGAARATTLIYYPLSSPLCGAVNCDQSQNDLYNWTTHIGGVAFPSGSRSLLFIGGHGTGKFCYGLPQDCGVSGNSKGPFAPPYRYQVWAYDVNDMIAVKNGSKSPSQIKPYAVWTLPDLPNQDISIQIAGATYDPDLQRLYITPHYGENPIVYVYQLSFVGAVAPSAPSNVSVQ